MAQPLETNTTDAPDGAILGSRATVPQHVVYRTFPTETVVLNLQTGRYHGLNVTAGRMLEALERSASVRDAVGLLASEYGQSVLVVRQDLCGLCRELLGRGLIEIDADQAR